MTNPRDSLLLLLLLAGTGCSKSDHGAVAAEITALRGRSTPRLPGFDAAAIVQKLQGTWVFGGSADELMVWSIDGHHLTQVDAAGSVTTGTLELTSPCEVMMAFPDGSAEGYGFTFEGDTLHLGNGNAGTIVGGTLYSCATLLLVRKTPGHGCEEETGSTVTNGEIEYTWRPAECTSTATTLTTKDGFGKPVTLQIHGTALYDDEMQHQVARKVASLAAGIAQQAETRRALDRE